MFHNRGKKILQCSHSNEYLSKKRKGQHFNLPFCVFLIRENPNSYFTKFTSLFLVEKGGINKRMRTNVFLQETDIKDVNLF